MAVFVLGAGYAFLFSLFFFFLPFRIAKATDLESWFFQRTASTSFSAYSSSFIFLDF